MLVITAEVLPGMQLAGAAAQAIILAEKMNCMVRFKFNGIECTAVSWNVIGDIVAAYEHDYKRIAMNGQEGLGDIPDKQRE